MFSWTFQETVETSASAEQIWGLWSSPDTWAKWDDGVEWVKSEGAFVTGTRGVMKPTGGPKVKFELVETTPRKSFKDRSFLPLTTLDFTHVYSPAKGPNEKASITHSVEMRGWLTPLFSRVIGSGIKKGLKSAMIKLTALAEHRQ